jgi:hypothetical protein
MLKLGTEIVARDGRESTSRSGPAAIACGIAVSAVLSPACSAGQRPASRVTQDVAVPAILLAQPSSIVATQVTIRRTTGNAGM